MFYMKRDERHVDMSIKQTHGFVFKSRDISTGTCGNFSFVYTRLVPRTFVCFDDFDWVNLKT